MPSPAVLPHHITTRRKGFRVKVVRKRQAYKQDFSFAGGSGQTREQALAAAVAWRDQLLANLPPHLHGLHRGEYSKVPSILRQPESGTRVGVSRLQQHMRSVKEPGGVVYVIYWVCYAMEGPGRLTRSKGFYVGREDTLTPEQDRHAYLSAVAFREHWEHCRDTGTHFDPSRYKTWRRITCYPFQPPE